MLHCRTLEHACEHVVGAQNKSTFAVTATGEAQTATDINAILAMLCRL
jgi:hypothetical protein